MNGEHPSKDKIQRHHDGELSQQEAADVQQHLRTCASCQAELDQLERLSDMVRWSTDETAAASEQSDLAFTQMFAEIERAVAAPANVVPLQKHAASPVMRAVPALGALALAAVALLMLTRSNTLPSDAGEEQLAMLHSEVTAVKFGVNAGQVFGIPLADGESVPVVWIDDEDEEE